MLLGYFIASRDRLWRWIAPNAFLAELLAGSIRFASIILGLIAALDVLGATALLGSVLGRAGVVGIALGFPVRDAVDNYVSSLMLSLRQPFRANVELIIAGFVANWCNKLPQHHGAEDREAAVAIAPALRRWTMM